MKIKKTMKELISLIPEGKENAVPVSYCATILRLPKREIHRLIRKARVSGCHICSTSDDNKPGYYMPISDAELFEYYQRTSSDALGRLATVDPIRRYLIKKGYTL